MDFSGSLREIEDALPNGFHDAYPNAVALDLLADTARVDLDIWVGDLDAPLEAEREAYRKATLWLRGLVYFVIDPPGPEGEWYEGKVGVRTSACGPRDDTGPEAQHPLPPLPEGAFAYWFYVGDWNSLIHVAAKGAALE